MTRAWIDNRRYFVEGGQAGIETKRGCPRRCVYCADPLSKGSNVRCRPPGAVADEAEALLAQSIDHIHTCDSEFNIPASHALAVCEELARRGLGDRLRWYAYCAPTPFAEDLAVEMRRAGFAGINFGADSGDEGMLRRLGRSYPADGIRHAVRACKDAGITTMLDLLIGGPGESVQSVTTTIDLMKEVQPDRVGVSVGVRVYPGTTLARQLEGRRDGLVGGSSPLEPLFFIEPALRDTLPSLLDRLIGEDDRFLFFDPCRPSKNYNYNANEVLAAAIKKGFRGAYWDILRRLAGE